MVWPESNNSDYAGYLLDHKAFVSRLSIEAQVSAALYLRIINSFGITLGGGEGGEKIDK